jgi:hypothetical protein
MDSNEYNEYIALIDKCAENSENFTIPNSEKRHAAYLIKTLFKKAQSTIRIFTGSLFEGVYGDKSLQEEARKFLRRDANNSVNIVYQESIDIDKSSFIQTIIQDEQKKGAIKIWRANEKFQDINNHFVVMDDTAFRFETDHANTKAIANFGDHENAIRLVDIFGRISQNSSPIL